MKRMSRLLRFCTHKPPLVVTQIDALKKAFIITLTNVPQRNILSSQTQILLERSLAQADSLIKKMQIRSVWIKSTGPVFSAGHDLKQLRTSTDPEVLFKRGVDICMSLRRMKVPVVCVVDGLVAGAGCELVLSCDIILATYNTQFAIPAIKSGLFPTTPSVLLSRLMSNHKKMMGILMLGQSLPAEEAYKFGLVSRLVKKEDLPKAEEELAEKINQLSAEVLDLGKREFYKQNVEKNVQQAYQLAIDGMCQNLNRKDCLEGIKAFKEKRHPQFNQK